MNNYEIVTDMSVTCDYESRCHNVSDMSCHLGKTVEFRNLSHGPWANSTSILYSSELYSVLGTGSKLTILMSLH